MALTTLDPNTALLVVDLHPLELALVADRVFGHPMMIGNASGIICMISVALAIEAAVDEIRRTSRNGAPSKATHPKREAI